MKTYRRIHIDDKRKIMERARQLVRGRIRIEFKEACFNEADSASVPKDWKSYWIPIGVKPCDYDGETLMSSAVVPATDTCWIDVQIAKNSEPVGCEAFWEPMDWMSAQFTSGRLVGLAGPGGAIKSGATKQ